MLTDFLKAKGRSRSFSQGLFPHLSARQLLDVTAGPGAHGVLAEHRPWLPDEIPCAGKNTIIREQHAYKSVVL